MKYMKYKKWKKLTQQVHSVPGDAAADYTTAAAANSTAAVNLERREMV